ncbi:hypothetical protein [Paractinoplanes durhamensis]|uniref:hypothetical protein n=1 Tax=Paractinoplanes durhamensis TaxID=113563 RepID=UPI003626684B
MARFLSGVADRESGPYAVLAGAVSSILEWVGGSAVWSFVLTSEPEFWGPMFDYLAFTACFEVEVDGRRHVGFGMDWRRLPVEAWLELMNEREHSGGHGPPRPTCCDRRRRPGPHSTGRSGRACATCAARTGPAG